MFCVDLRTNNDYFPMQHVQACLCEADAMCLPRGRNSDASLSSLYHYNILFSCFLLHFLHRFTSVLLSLQSVDIHCPQLHCSSTLITNFPVSGRQPCGEIKTLLHSWSKCNILAYDAVYTSGWVETIRRDTAFIFLIKATCGRTQYKD